MPTSTRVQTVEERPIYECVKSSNGSWKYNPDKVKVTPPISDSRRGIESAVCTFCSAVFGPIYRSGTPDYTCPECGTSYCSPASGVGLRK